MRAPVPRIAERAKGLHPNLNLRVHRALSWLDGATWSSQASREQLRDGVYMLGKLVPVFILTMLESPQTQRGPAVDTGA